jgi:hypothetical protein
MKSAFPRHRIVDSMNIDAASNLRGRCPMHVSIERLYDFIMEETDLTEAEQCHLVRCSECITWLDACVAEKVSLMKS